MSRILQDEKLTSPILNGSNIGLLPNGFINVGGQQFKSNDFIDAPLPSFVGLSNTLFFIYAVLNPGPKLVISQNVNSVGPGFNSWKLVGAFYSDGSTTVSFGSFVNIVGPAITDSIAYAVSNSGLGTITGDTFNWTRNGNRIFVSGTLVAGTVSASQLQVNLPVVNSQQLLMGPMSSSGEVIGDFSTTNATVSVSYVALGGNNGSGIKVGRKTIATNVQFFFQNANQILLSGETISLSVNIPVTAWDNKPLKDL